MPDAIKVLLFPLLFLLSGILASTQVAHFPLIWLQIIPAVFASIFIILLGLAWRFNKGRLILVSLALTYPVVMLEIYSEEAIQSFTSVPLLMLLIAGLVTEKGFANRFSFNRLLFVGMLTLWNIATVSGWVSLDRLAEIHFSVIGKSLRDVLLIILEVLAIGAVLIRMIFSSDRFSAALLVSVTSFVVLHYVSLGDNQIFLILGSQGLLWSWFLLAESHRMAYRDELTGLPSRRALNEDFLALPKRYAVAMVDVDHFKKFNDTYGHDMGDEVLRRVAKLLREGSYHGTVYRYGGEEFSVLYRGKKVDGAEEELEGIRARLEAERIDILHKGKEKSVNVTASFGLALTEVGEEGYDTLKKADESLYQAKKKGRNRIVVYGKRGKSVTKGEV